MTVHPVYSKSINEIAILILQLMRSLVVIFHYAMAVSKCLATCSPFFIKSNYCLKICCVKASLLLASTYSPYWKEVYIKCVLLIYIYFNIIGYVLLLFLTGWKRAGRKENIHIVTLPAFSNLITVVNEVNSVLKSLHPQNLKGTSIFNCIQLWAQHTDASLLTITSGILWYPELLFIQ